MPFVPSINWRALRCGLLFGSAIFSVVKWYGSWHHSYALMLLDVFQPTIQHGQPLDPPAWTELGAFDDFDPSTYFRPSMPSTPSQEPNNPFVSLLPDCSGTAIASINPTTSHRRLAAQYLNISLTPPDSSPILDRHFNPTFLRLPSWAVSSPAAKGAKYVLVARRVTEGLHQESFICLADLCLPQSSSLSPDTRKCTTSDHQLLGTHGGLRCTTTPERLNIPPTPSLHCSGRWSSFPYFPGFHDPRIFWSNRGEPLIIVNSASQYGCLGLWLLDLRTVYPDLVTVLSRDGRRKSWQSSVIRYEHLTELTRHDRAEVEKNWMLFFPGGSSSSSSSSSRNKDDEGDTIVQYDIAPTYDFSSTAFENPSSSGGRTLSLLHSNTGITIKANLTSPLQPTCFPPSSVFDSLGQHGYWHQSTNSLKLILCTRSQFRSADRTDKAVCGPGHDWLSSGREVHFSIIHRKFSSKSLNLPMRYERYAVVWEGRQPWRMIGVSQSPILFKGEVAQPWTKEENDEINSPSRSPSQVVNEAEAEAVKDLDLGWGWQDAQHHHKHHRQDQQTNTNTSPSTQNKREDTSSAASYFTYTPSIAWAWQPATDHDHFDATAGEDDKNMKMDIDIDIAELERLGIGFLGDELLVGIGLDDTAQAMVRVKVDDLLACLRLCEQEGYGGQNSEREQRE